MEHPFQLVRMVFPNATDEEADALLWGRTGFPGFWRTGNPRRDILHSLREYDRAIRRGHPVCEFCSSKAVTPKRKPDLCSWCDKALNRRRREE